MGPVKWAALFGVANCQGPRRNGIQGSIAPLYEVQGTVSRPKGEVQGLLIRASKRVHKQLPLSADVSMDVYVQGVCHSRRRRRGLQLCRGPRRGCLLFSWIDAPIEPAYVALSRRNHGFVCICKRGLLVEIAGHCTRGPSPRTPILLA